MRAQEKHVEKFPIKVKVEGLVVYVIPQNFGVDVAASVEIIPQILRPQRDNDNSLQHPFSRAFL